MVCLFPSASFSKKKSDRTWIRANLVAMCASAKKPAPNFYRLVYEGPFFYRFIIIQKEPPFWKWWLTSRVYMGQHRQVPPPPPHPMVMGLHSSAPVPLPPCGVGGGGWWWWWKKLYMYVYECICMVWMYVSSICIWLWYDMYMNMYVYMLLRSTT